MNLKDMTKEELETMSYDDIAYFLLTDKKKAMKIIDLFNEVGKLVGLSKNVIEDKIGDFFEMLTLDKRFIMLDDGSWDLRIRHAQNIVIEDEEEEISADEIEGLEETEEEDDIFYDEEDTDDSDDDLKDLVVIDEDDSDEML